MRLRRAEPDDAPALFAAATSPGVMTYMDWTTGPTDAGMRTHLVGAARRWRDGSEYQWTIEERSTGLVAGTVSCRIVDDAADVGYFLARSQWGKGLASDAARLVVDWLKSRPAIVRICATSDVENSRSHRTLERLGLRREAVRAGATVRPNLGGPPRGAVVYAWTRNRR